MKAIITVYAQNGVSMIECRTWEELEEFTSKFDKTGVDYSIEYKRV